jgi:hypothetical protein
LNFKVGALEITWKIKPGRAHLLAAHHQLTPACHHAFIARSRCSTLPCRFHRPPRSPSPAHIFCKLRREGKIGFRNATPSCHPALLCASSACQPPSTQAMPPRLQPPEQLPRAPFLLEHTGALILESSSGAGESFRNRCCVRERLQPPTGLSATGMSSAFAPRCSLTPPTAPTIVSQTPSPALLVGRSAPPQIAAPVSSQPPQPPKSPPHLVVVLPD